MGDFTAITIMVLSSETNKQAVYRTFKGYPFPIWCSGVVQYDMLAPVADAPVIFLTIDEIPIIDVKYKMTGEWIIRFEQA